MWQFRDVWSCKLGDMIFQSCTFFSLALGVRNLNVNLLVGTVQYIGEAVLTMKDDLGGLQVINCYRMPLPSPSLVITSFLCVQFLC